MKPPSKSPNPIRSAGAIGAASRLLRGIRLQDPGQRGLVDEMEVLRVSGIGRAPGESCWGLRVIEQTGSGKSEAAKQMVARVARQPGRARAGFPVLHVTLGTLGTPRDAVASCLKEFRGCGYSTKGTEGDLLERLEVALDEQGTELMIVDELNHCAGKSQGPDVADTFKNMLTKGWVPIALLGTSKAKVLFDSNRELRRRCPPYLGLRPAHHVVDIEAWTSFAFGMECEMKRLKIVDAPIGLDDPALTEALCIACSGTKGDLVNVLENALTSAMWAGSRTIDLHLLKSAVETLFVLDGPLKSNSLRDIKPAADQDRTDPMGDRREEQRSDAGSGDSE